MSSPLERFSKWLQVKIFQFEVTFAVYIFTPVEKFVFYSVFFLLISLTSIAIVLYLPQHLALVLNRTWFYMSGDSADVKDVVVEAAKQAVHSITAGGGVVAATATGAAAAAAETVVETAAAVVREL